MSYKNREIESKLLVYGKTLQEVNEILYSIYGEYSTRSLFGSSVDTYWTVNNPDVPAQFIRMRERDGIRQITVKGKDKDTNLDRIEIDVDSTSSVSTIRSMLTALLGKPVGRLGKTYYVYWPEKSEHTTVCCYSVSFPDTGKDYEHIILEVETTNMNHMLELEAKVITEFNRQGAQVERAPGSLYEMFLDVHNTVGIYVP